MKIYRSLAALAAGALLHASTASVVGAQVIATEDLAQVTAPPIEALGPLTHIVRPDQIIVLNGNGPEDNLIQKAGPYPLIEAILMAKPGDVLGIDGDIPGAGMQFGGGDAGQKLYRAHWGMTPIEITIVGLRPNRESQINSFYLHKDLNNGVRTGGVKHIRVQNLTILSPPSDTRCIGVPKGADSFGLVQVYDVNFKGASDGSFDGLGYKWGIRAAGRMQWDIRNVHAAPVQEHVFYIDSPSGNSYFVNCTMEGSWRTMVQIVNRRIDNPGPSGFGTLLFEDMTAYNVFGEGGSAFTVAGHLGALIFRNCRVIEGPNGSHGAMAIWVDDSPGHGAHFDADGFANGPVIIDDLRVYAPNADRNHVSISGARSLYVDEFAIYGNRTAFLFKQLAWPNGRIRFLVQDPVSQYPGFLTPWKIQWHATHNLTDAEIDALWWPE